MDFVRLMPPPRVLIALQPSMYAEVLVFSIRQRRPDSEVAILGPSDDLEAESARSQPHLVVADRVPQAVKDTTFWVEFGETAIGTELSAEISADGYSRSVDSFRLENVIEALDRAGNHPLEPERA